MEIVSRPDTDAIERERNLYYSEWKNLKFRECPACAEKPGSPYLCESCLHNREVISKLLQLSKTYDIALARMHTEIHNAKKQRPKGLEL